MSKLLTRTLSGAVYVLLFVGSIYSGRLLQNELAGRLIMGAFQLFVAEGCAFEYYRMVRSKGGHPNNWLGYLLCALCVVASLLDSSACHRLLYATALLIPIVLIAELWRGEAHPFADAAHTLLPLLYIALPVAMMQPLNHNGMLMMLLILIWVNDSFAYLGGSLLGKHKLWVRHSPGKTWEGCVCGLLGTLLAAYFVGPLFQSPLLAWHWLVVALMASVIGTLGDLVESMLKRSCGVKDSGNIMPGHGGFLDRFDSLLIVIPFVYIFAQILFTL